MNGFYWISTQSMPAVGSQSNSGTLKASQSKITLRSDLIRCHGAFNRD